MCAKPFQLGDGYGHIRPTMGGNSDRNKACNGLAVTRDDHLIAALDTLQQRREMSLRVERPNRDHNHASSTYMAN